MGVVLVNGQLLRIQRQTLQTTKKHAPSIPEGHQGTRSGFSRRGFHSRLPSRCSRSVMRRTLRSRPMLSRTRLRLPTRRL